MMTRAAMYPYALLFIATGLYLAIGAFAGFGAVNAALVLGLGLYRFRLDRSRLSVIVMAAALFVLVIHHVVLLAACLLLAAGIYFWLSRKPAWETGALHAAHRMVLSLRLDERPWVLKSMHHLHAVGEVRMDLSLAVPEEKETVIVLKGVLGDADLTIPEDYGLEIDASVLIGQVGFGQAMDGWFQQRVCWRSPDYDRKEYKVKLQLSYLVGEIRIRAI